MLDKFLRMVAIHIIDQFRRLQTDLLYHRRLQATKETLQFIEDHLKGITCIDMSQNKKAMLDYLIPQINPKGLIIECGVFKGRTINHIAKKIPNRTIHGFDSFQGLPNDWEFLPKNTFNLNGVMPKVEKNIVLHKGLFSDTLPKFNQTTDESIAFLHVDGDLYSSAKTILDSFDRKIIPGTIILFDEFFNFPGWQEHEYKAWSEFSNNIKYDFIAYTNHTQVALKIIKTK